MGKTIAITAKFTEKEADRIEAMAVAQGTSKSAVLHELVMKGFEAPKAENTAIADTVRFRFTEDFAYFWKDREYPGFIRDGEAHIKFGGDWKIYDLSKIPVEVLGASDDE